MTPDQLEWAVKKICLHSAHKTAGDAIRAAIAFVLEEAAKVADRNASEAWKEGAEETRGLMRLQAADIANTIRAMKNFRSELNNSEASD